MTHFLKSTTTTESYSPNKQKHASRYLIANEPIQTGNFNGHTYIADRRKYWMNEVRNKKQYPQYYRKRKQ